MARLPIRLALVTVLAAGCAGSAHRSVHLRTPFVQAGPQVTRECRRAARAVGYAVLCPMRIPRGLVGTPTGIPTRNGRGIGFETQPGCRPRFAIVGLPPCPDRGGWKGWVVGSSAVPRIAGSSDPFMMREHLVVDVSPRPIRDYAQAADGPGWYKGARVDVGQWVDVDGLRARWVFVPPATNDGSAFAGHVVLVWTAGGHTYAAGFHDTSTRRATKAMDIELVRHLRLIAS